MPRTSRPTADAARFGAIVMSHRKQLGWSRKKVAMRAGLTPQYLAIVEEGGNIPSLTTILELTEVLGADVAAIMGELAAARKRPPA